MKYKSGISLVLVAILSAAGSVIAYRSYTKPSPIEVSSPVAENIVVIRTPGGWLELATVKVDETFDGQVPHEILGMSFDPTITRIRVPAFYTYRIRLAAEWKILEKGKEFVVIAPRLEPSLPVAVDLSKMEKYASGTWSLFTGTEALESTERQITDRLAAKALSPMYVDMQRREARQTLAEFVKRWLMEQSKWQDMKGLPLRVLFADEPIQRLGPDLVPLN